MNLQEDPGTTLVGVVIDGEGALVEGAEVHLDDSALFAVTEADGTFALPDVPTANPPSVTVLGDSGGFIYLDHYGPFTGRSAGAAPRTLPSAPSTTTSRSQIPAGSLSAGTAPTKTSPASALGRRPALWRPAFFLAACLRRRFGSFFVPTHLCVPRASGEPLRFRVGSATPPLCRPRPDPAPPSNTSQPPSGPSTPRASSQPDERSPPTPWRCRSRASAP